MSLLSRSCALAICNRLELKLSQVVNTLDEQFAADSAAWAALQPGQLSAAVKEAAAASDLDANSISNLLAVVYTLSIAAPAAADTLLAKQSNAVNCLVSMASAHCKPCSSVSAADRWQEWQQILSATGLNADQLPVLLTAASKAFLVHLAAVHASQQITVARVKVCGPYTVLSGYT